MTTYHNRVKETSTTTGTGSITLLGAVSQFSSFISRYATFDLFSYCIEGQTGSEWEVGLGMLLNSTTLLRASVEQSSNADGLVSFSAGTKNVFITVPARIITGMGATGSCQLNFGQAPGSNIASALTGSGYPPTTGSKIMVSLDPLNANGITTTAPDGRTWTKRISPGLGPIQDIVQYPTDGSFVVLFKSAANVIATTTDFITYTPQTNGLGTLGYSLTYANGQFIATGSAGALCTSPDGVTWTTQTSSFGTSIIYGVVYVVTPALYIAAGQGGKVATSPTGVTWTQLTSPTSSDLTGICLDTNTSFATIVGDSSYYTDGTTVYGPFGFAYITGNSIPRSIYADKLNNKKVTLSSPYLYTATSAQTSQEDKKAFRPTTSIIISVVFADNIFLAICSDGTMLRSLNGGQWHPHNKLKGITVGATGLIRYSGATLFILTTSGDIYTSPDVSVLNNGYEHSLAPIKLTVSAVTPGVNFEVTGTSDLRLTGTYAVNWSHRS